ncbi:MAG TPA: DUF6531 domain-containing protein [Candidatus Saccharimonadia bacterium]|nr:DUF6531 domain-containing protein [Candidatus Saccharimonadia bacterium]
MRDGNNKQVAHDYEGPKQSLLQFTRTYNSLGGRSRLTQSKWLTTFDRSIRMPDEKHSEYRLRRPDGLQVWYEEVDGKFVPHSPFGIALERNATGWRVRLPDGGIEEYSPGGSLQRMARADGTEVVVTYGESPERPVRATESTGAFLEFFYTGDKLTELRDHRGRRWTYEYVPYVNVSHVVGPDGVHRTYHYEDYRNPWSLTGVSVGRTYPPAPEDRAVTWAYDAENRAIFSELKGGINRTEVEYLDDLVRIARSPTGTREYTYVRMPNGARSLARKVRIAEDGTRTVEVEYAYDASGALVETVRPGLRETQASLNEANKPARRVLAAGTADEMSVDQWFDARFPEKLVRSAAKHLRSGEARTVEMQYDAWGRPTSMSVSHSGPGRVPYSATWTLAYAGPDRKLSSIDGPKDGPIDAIRYEYDDARRLSRVVRTDGAVIRDAIRYDPLGRIVAERRGTHSIQYSYDAVHDWVNQATLDRNGTIARLAWTHGPRRRVVAVELALDGETRHIDLEVDGANRIVVARSTLGHRLVFSHPNSPGFGRVTLSAPASSQAWFSDFLDDSERFLEALRGAECECLDAGRMLSHEALSAPSTFLRLHRIARYAQSDRVGPNDR